MQLEFHGAVRTVKVFSKDPLEQAVEIAVDRGSRSSVALLRVLLGEMYGTEPDLHVCEPRPEALFTHYDTVLVIGDRADEVDQAGLHVYDLGEMWHELTGLPFVFAAWVMSERMSSEDARRSELIAVLTEARIACAKWTFGDGRFVARGVFTAPPNPLAASCPLAELRSTAHKVAACVSGGPILAS